MASEYEQGLEQLLVKANEERDQAQRKLKSAERVAKPSCACPACAVLLGAPALAPSLI